MPRKIIIHKALYRPALFVGCERLPFIVVVTIGGTLIMAYQTIVVFSLVLAYYLVSIMLIRRINEDDSQFFSCLFRYVYYFQDYYSAHGFYPGRIDTPYSYFR